MSLRHPFFRPQWLLNSLACAAVASGVFAAPSADAQWANLDSIDDARFESSSFQYENDLYVFNGFGPGIDLEANMNRYNADTLTWDNLGTTNVLGTSVTHNGVVNVGSDVWVVGGREGDHPGGVVDRVWIYNVENNSWRNGPSLPVPVAAGGAALVNNKIHWIGGLDPQASCDVPHHFVYDLGNTGAGWQEITNAAAMPVPRNHFATAVLNGEIYTIGGQFGHDSCSTPGSNTQDTDLVHAYNPVSMQWTQKASLPHVNSHIEPGTFVHAGAIYVVGGESEGGFVVRYNPSADEWDTVIALPENLIAPAARVVDGKLVVASGGAPSGSNPVATVRYTDIEPLLLSDSDQTRVVHISKRNQPFALDGNNGAANGQSTYLWASQQNNVNQQWIEIPRGNGFYSYRKFGTNHCLDGGNGGANAQDLYLWNCSTNNLNQHWKRINVGGTYVRLEKRNASGFSIDGNNGGDFRQNVYLWGSNQNNINQHWQLTELNVDLP